MSTPGIPFEIPPSTLRAPFVDETLRLTDDTQRWLRQLTTFLGLKVPIEANGTRAARIKLAASSFAQGNVWRESDTGLFYVAEGNSWLYLAGAWVLDSNNVPVDLASNDVGLLLAVTDFNHLLRWNGEAFEWAPGELGSDWITSFLSAPNVVGWQVCDGSANVSRLNADGSVDTVTVPNIAALAGTAGYYYRT